MKAAVPLGLTCAGETGDTVAVKTRGHPPPVSPPPSRWSSIERERLLVQWCRGGAGEVGVTAVHSGDRVTAGTGEARVQDAVRRSGERRAPAMVDVASWNATVPSVSAGGRDGGHGDGVGNALTGHRRIHR